MNDTPISAAGGGMEGDRSMSVKIRVSYTDDEELAGVIRLLSPVVKSWKVAKRQESAYRNAYIYLHPFDRTNEERSHSAH